MNIRLADPAAFAGCDTLILPLLEGPDRKRAAQVLPGALAVLAKTPGLDDAPFAPKETALLYAPDGAPCRRVLTVGCGAAEGLDTARLRAAVAAAARLARERRAGSLAVCLAGLPLPTQEAVREAALALRFGLYRFLELKTGDDLPPDPEDAALLPGEAGGDGDPAAALRLAEAEAAGVALARDLVNRPGNHATAARIAEEARALAVRHGFSFQVMDRAAIEALGMGAFAAVAQGSRAEPCFVVLDTAPEGGRPLCLVGKGVTFDTGGISLKPAAKMEEMKSDMAGAAAVLGCLEALGRLGSPRRVAGLLPLTDNMPDGGGVKPGDVVRTLSGLSVEIINTDAEGRLLLADALAFAARLEPEAVVDLATLTGAARIALGVHYAAVFSPDGELARRIREAGLPLGEKFWPMPMDEVYAKELESDVADLRNVGRREGGAIIAAMFLKRFAPEGVPWAHLDIAPTAFQDAATDFWTKGATGFGVRTLIALAGGA